jgi:hypothetical protein
MWPQTPAERWRLAIAAPHLLPSAHTPASASTTSSFRGSTPHPMQSLCTLRTPRCRDARNTRYRAARYALPGRDSHPLDRASFAWRTVGRPLVRVPVSRSDAARAKTAPPASGRTAGRSRRAGFGIGEEAVADDGVSGRQAPAGRRTFPGDDVTQTGGDAPMRGRPGKRRRIGWRQCREGGRHRPQRMQIERCSMGRHPGSRTERFPLPSRAAVAIRADLCNKMAEISHFS